MSHVIPPSPPMLNLKMKVTKRSSSSAFSAAAAAAAAGNTVPSVCMEERQAQIRVMLRQDRVNYTCEDYLSRRNHKHSMKRTRCEDACPDIRDACMFSSRTPPHDLRQPQPKATPAAAEDPVDAVCREKMCEWSYRVCDHFQCDREVVAVAFSYLDRFIDRCACDRTAFKLAAMTTLYMATKIINSKQISIRSLSELSRGEFDVAHIAEMEAIILQTLHWRMHPPTPQSFVNNLLGQLRIPQNGQLALVLHQRSTFFAELSLYDYTFVPIERSVIAISSILNAMEGVDDSVVSQAQQDAFLATVVQRYGFRSDEIEYVRNRLWYIYSVSAQCQMDEPCMVQHQQKQQLAGLPVHPAGKNSPASTDPDLEHSPVSVATSH